MSTAPPLTLASILLRARGRALPLVDLPLLELAPGLTAIVGASGAGKSLLGRILVGQHHVQPGLSSGTLTVGQGPSIALSALPPRQPPAPALISWACQHGRDALVPQWTVRRHLRGEPTAEVEDRLRRLGLEPSVLDRYPHELSGGMAQRVHLAVALGGDPPWLVADEVTTGLDASAARWVCGWLAERAAQGRGVLLISHDLDLVKDHADRILVMDAGCVVEDGPAARWHAFTHPAARRLIAAADRLEER